MENENLIQTFIVVHNQDLIKNFEQKGKYKALNYKYLFVGKGDVSQLSEEELSKTIVIRDYEGNFEHYPHFYDFTAWHVLWKHRLIDTPYFVSIQYDFTVTNEKAEDIILGKLQACESPLGMLEVPHFLYLLQDLIPGIAEAFKAKGLGPEFTREFATWPCSQGTAWPTEIFYEFMEWFEPLFEVLKDHVWCGHVAERMIWAFMQAKNLPPHYAPGLFHHESKNVHGTSSMWGRGKVLFSDNREREKFFR